MNYRHTITTLAALLFVASPAWAQDTAASESAQTSDGPVYERGGLFGAGVVIAPKFGVGFGQLTSDFGTSPVFELELGWVVLPFPDLQIFTSLQYAQPKQSGSGTDSRLPGDGAWTYELTEQQLVLTPGLLYRIPVGGDLFRPYVAAGPRFYFDKTTVNGETSGEPFGEYTETGTSVGAYGALGGDLFVGPGSILLELQFGWASIDRYVLRETNTSTLNIAVGYRFFL
jgi:hypothetical protein